MHGMYVRPSESSDVALSRVGYWSRDEMVKMDRKALARMVMCHPDLCPQPLRTALRKTVNNPVYSEVFPNIPDDPKPDAEAILAALFGALSEETEHEEDSIKIDRMYVETAKAIRQAVAQKHGISLTTLDSHRRVKVLVRARQEAMYLIISQTTLSYPRVARMFGNRDHTTVLHGAEVHAQRNSLPSPRNSRHSA